MAEEKRESYVDSRTLAYMRKHKLGMFSKADKKLVKENTPPDYSAKSKALKAKMGEKYTKPKNAEEMWHNYDHTTRFYKNLDKSKKNK